MEAIFTFTTFLFPLIFFHSPPLLASLGSNHWATQSPVPALGLVSRKAPGFPAKEPFAVPMGTEIEARSLAWHYAHGAPYRYRAACCPCSEDLAASGAWQKGYTPVLLGSVTLAFSGGVTVLPLPGPGSSSRSP